MLRNLIFLVCLATVARFKALHKLGKLYFSIDTLAVSKILKNSKIHGKDLFDFFWLRGMLSFENQRLQATRERPQIVGNEYI